MENHSSRLHRIPNGVVTLVLIIGGFVLVLTSITPLQVIGVGFLLIALAIPILGTTALFARFMPDTEKVPTVTASSNASKPQASETENGVDE